MTQVGFLGLGAMGSAIANRLLTAGHDVTVWNRSDGPVEAMVAAGARPADSAREALATPISFSMLANDDAVASVVDEESLAGRGGRVHVCLSSISPEAADALGEKCRQVGIGYVSAPVIGRPDAAKAGKLNVLLGGEPKQVAKVRHLVRAFSVRGWDIGPEPSSANIVKIAVNYNIIHSLQALGESVAMVERNGADSSAFVDLLRSTLFGGIVYEGYGRLIAERAYRPAGFTVALGRKDLALAQRVAEAAGLRLATMPALVQVFDEALSDASFDGCDWSVVAEVSRRSGGTVPGP